MITPIKQDKIKYSRELRRSAELYMIRCFKSSDSAEYIEPAMHIITGREYVPITAVADNSIKLDKYELEELRHDMGELPDDSRIYTE